MKMKQGEKYEILWLDTFGFNGWYSVEELKEKAKENKDFQTTVGFYVGEAHGFIITASHYNKNPSFDPFGHPCWIPKGCIIKKTKL